MMRRLIFSLSVIILTIACGTLSPAEQAEQARKIRTALDERRYKIDVRMMYPRRGPSKSVASNWSLEVRGDTLVSYLPYIGRAYNIPYGGGKGMNFTALIGSYTEEKGRKGERLITMSVDNEEDQFVYRVEVFSDGQATIDVQPRERESISYSGELE